MRRFASSIASLVAHADLASIAPRPAAPPAFERIIPAELPIEHRYDARRLLFDGASNFRDVGGLRGLDGRRVRWGRVYRSDALVQLSAADLAFLARLDLKTIVDLRSAEERAEGADPSIPGVGRLELTMPVHAVNPQKAKERALAGLLDAETSARDMKAAYRQLVDELTPRFGDWLRAVAGEEPAPILVHCTAGKDRTGFAIALLLLALGVSMDDVMRDYLATNEFTRARRLRSILKATVFSRFKTSADDILPLLKVDASYLETAFERATERYGSFEGYLDGGLGIDEGALSRLQERLLEPAPGRG